MENVNPIVHRSSNLSHYVTNKTSQDNDGRPWWRILSGCGSEVLGSNPDQIGFAYNTEKTEVVLEKNCILYRAPNYSKAWVCAMVSV